MPQCAKCKNFYGPDHMVSSTDDKKVIICRFCRAGKDDIRIFQGEGELKEIVTIRKQECINKYKEFINRMVKAEGIRRRLIRDTIQGKV